MSTHIRERLLHAFSSRDLSLSPDKQGDADYLIALGLASAGEPMPGDGLMRLHLGGSQMDYRRVREDVVRLTKRLSAARNWRLSGANARRVGEAALAHYVFPTCPACHGRCYEVAEGAPVLSGVICRACHGTGLRPVQRKFNAEIRDVIEVLEDLQKVTARGVARRMR